MRIIKANIKNFRGIKSGEFFFPKHGVLVGDNNTGKSTVLEAIDLVLGPDRMRKVPVIDEHDFYAGDYLNTENEPIEIFIEVIISELSQAQETYFKNNIEWWDSENNTLLTQPPAEATDSEHTQSVVRVSFSGKYNAEDDDFLGNTYFESNIKENGEKTLFSKSDKRHCGFLFLRTIRTGSRALSLERGSLLDIILNLSDIKLNMWEETLGQLRSISIETNTDIGVSSILSSVQKSLRSLVPSEWGTDPQMKVSDFTREHLRKSLNVFIATGAKKSNGEIHIAPFKKQGTGTINTLVLSMLSIIADLKKNVIFAMEEPEIAIPPSTQKRIIDSIIEKSSQALFTSHSPYILEEFDLNEIMVLKKENGIVSSINAKLPKSIKRKQFKEQFRKKYCEAILSKRVLITEGRTEYDAFPAAARRLHALAPDSFSSLEALGIAVIDAESDSHITAIAEVLTQMGKITYAVYDKQGDSNSSSKIGNTVNYPFESPESSFEKLIVNHFPYDKLKKHALSLVQNEIWPEHLNNIKPTSSHSEKEIRDALLKFFIWGKGSGLAADFVETCELLDFPEFIKETLKSIRVSVSPIKENNDHSGNIEYDF
ncbi:ATP-dependent nuclease [Legionella quinlivanii]|uniref:ATP-dependent nuclease n=1 Tax=Legionella quinlivanii TaxID=45073 RepID=UPI0022430C73|nr:AAA family ATPase [Legionella quinlivanii]MCW8451799.1 ATP-binding protein [Legionella quinlivanii]